MKRTLKILLICLVIGIFLSTVALAADSGQLGVSKPSKLDIAIERNYAKQFTYSEVYSELPVVSSDHTAGALTDEYLQSGLAHLNYIRYTAGLPYATMVDSWNEHAQYGAVVLAANDVLTHYPEYPEGMEPSFYQKGSDATASSNISYSRGYGERNYLIFSLTGCMSDNSSSNMPMLGHRRWLLNPLVKMNVGFGEAKAVSGSNYVVTRVFDREVGIWNLPKVDYEFIAWPASGNFPTELITMKDPWSVTLNPNLYQTPDINAVNVIITRESDGVSWTMNIEDYTNNPVNTAPYFNVETTNYGVNNCIIFTPGQLNWGTSSFGGVYNIHITGLKLKNGLDTVLDYDVEFFDVEKVSLPQYTVSVNTSSGGTASFVTKQVTAGSNVTLTLTPDDGCQLAVVYIDGARQPLQETYTLERITYDTEVNVIFTDSGGCFHDGVLRYSVQASTRELTVEGLVDPYMSGSVNIPEKLFGLSVTTIGDAAFSGSYLTSVTLPDSIKTIGEKAFSSSCIQGSMVIPASVQSIGTYAFSYMFNVTEFLMEENEKYACMDGVLFEKSDGKLSTLLNYPLASTRDTYVVPYDVTTLYCTSFAGAENLTTLYLPNASLWAMTFTFALDELTIYGRKDTQFYTHWIAENRFQEAELAFYDIEAEPVIKLENGRVRIIHLKEAVQDSVIVMATYENGRMSDVTMIDDVDLMENSVCFLSVDFIAENIRFFHLSSTFAPLRAPIDQ